MHTLKSLSGSIGAESLQENAAQLEQAISEKATRNELDPVIQKTRTMLLAMTNSIESTLPELKKEKNESGPEASEEEMLRFLEELRPHIIMHKPKKCEEILEELRQCRWPSNLQAEASEVDRLTSKYKFKEALATVDSLVLKLKGADHA